MATALVADIQPLLNAPKELLWFNATLAEAHHYLKNMKRWTHSIPMPCKRIHAHLSMRQKVEYGTKSLCGYWLDKRLAQVFGSFYQL